tara:strand:+ start:990 stop:2276 length:1287 start_codon:yes stop_codon:yes gene_type:complete
MATNEYNPAGSGGLKELRIQSGSQKINLIPLLESIQINENLMGPSFTGMIYIIDALDIINSLPIIGEEIVTCVLNTPPLGDRKYTFMVTAVDNIVSTASSTASRYILTLATLEEVENALVSVDTYLNNMIAIDAFKVYQDTLENIDNTPFNYHSTGNRSDYLSNGLLPFEVMDHLCGKAYSQDSSASYFTFYRNIDGFNFHDLELLIQNGRDNPVAEYSYAESIRTSGDDKNKWINDFYNIKDYVIDKRSNIGDRIYNGGLSSSVEEVDVISKKITYHDYVSHAFFNNTKKFATDETAVNPNSDSFLEKYAYKINNQTTYITDATRSDVYATSIIPRRLSYSLLTQNMKMSVTVQGNVELSVGKIVKLNIPTVHGFTVPKLSDELVSGNWLITNLDHVTNGQNFESIFKCIKVGFKKGFRNEEHYKKQ